MSLCAPIPGNMRQVCRTPWCGKVDHGFQQLRSHTAFRCLAGGIRPRLSGLTTRSARRLQALLIRIGVKIFFVISGYLIARSQAWRSVAVAFTLRRCLRIVPGLTVVVLLTVLVLGPLATSCRCRSTFRNSRT